MRSQILNALKVSALAIVLSVGLGYVYALTFDVPTSQPPGGNLPGFIDVGSVGQKKLGSLGVGTDPVAGYGLTAYGTSGLYGWATAGSGVNGSGLTGISGNSSAGIGSGVGTGVSGTGGNVAVAGNGEHYGLIGTASNATGIGVSGQGAYLGLSGISTQYGVLGQGTGASGIGVMATGTKADLYVMNSGILFPDGTIQKTAASWKQCEGSNGTSFNEVFTVPTTWTRAQCFTLLQAHVSPLSWWKVGCLSASGPTAGDFGAAGGGLPTNNSCGWDVPVPPPPPPPGDCGALAIWKGLCN